MVLVRQIPGVFFAVDAQSSRLPRDSVASLAINIVMTSTFPSTSFLRSGSFRSAVKLLQKCTIRTPHPCHLHQFHGLGFQLQLLRGRPLSHIRKHAEKVWTSFNMLRPSKSPLSPPFGVDVTILSTSATSETTSEPTKQARLCRGSSWPRP
jgi:hypothetical protein